MSDEDPNNIRSFLEKQEQRAKARADQRMQPIMEALDEMADQLEQQIDFLAVQFGLTEAHTPKPKVLRYLVDASEEMNDWHAPFRLTANLPYLYRAYKFIDLEGGPNNLMGWQETADIIRQADAENDDPAATGYNHLPDYLKVPEEVRAELAAITAGISANCDYCGSCESFVYLCLIRAVLASLAATKP